MALRDADASRHLAYALQLALGLVFVLAVVPKLRHPRAFASTVAEYRIVPAAVADHLAVAFISAEAFVAVAFFTGWLSVVAIGVAVGTLAAFLAATGVNLRRGHVVPCGCFGDARERISLRSVARLLMLLGAALALIAFQATGTGFVTVAALADDGVGALAYLAEIGSFAGGLLLAGLWALTLPELARAARKLLEAERLARDSERQGAAEGS